MKTQRKISNSRLNRLRAQGYSMQTDQEIADLAIGNRMAFQLCSSVLIVAVITANVSLLFVMLTIAFLGVILPYHPFDHIYNYGVRTIYGGPKLPPRSNQLKLACAMATTFIGVTIALFSTGHTVAGYVVGISLICSAVLVSTTDICVPSIIYNALVDRKNSKPAQV